MLDYTFAGKMKLPLALMITRSRYLRSKGGSSAKVVLRNESHSALFFFFWEERGGLGISPTRVVDRPTSHKVLCMPLDIHGRSERGEREKEEAEIALALFGSEDNFDTPFETYGIVLVTPALTPL